MSLDTDVGDGSASPQPPPARATASADPAATSARGDGSDVADGTPSEGVPAVPVADDVLIRNAAHLRTIADALPGLVAYLDDAGRYQFVSATYERWFGRPRAELLGRTVEEVIGPAAYHTVEPYLRRALAGEEVRFEAELAYQGSAQRWVEGHYLPQRAADGAVAGCVVLVVDIDERKAFERFRAAAADRGERLLRITAAIADAVSGDEVQIAVVDQVGAAMGASTASLWLLDDDRRSVRLARATGWQESNLRRFAEVALDHEPSFPALDVIRTGTPRWIPSQAALLREYPALQVAVSPGRAYRVACLPLVSRGRTLGALALSIDEEREIAEDDRDLLLVVARYAGQAIERVRLLAENQVARARAEHLYRFAEAVMSAARVEEVHEVALSVIADALRTDRAAILLFDDDGVMRFRAARGLSAEYRAAVEGHSAWPRDVVAPRPVLVEDAMADPALADYRPLFAREGIGSLAFIPLSTRGRLIGKFMVYHPGRHVYTRAEVELATAIANHLASVIARFNAIGELEETIRYNELFAGVLAHDLRNPLGAMMTAAQIMLMRHDEGDRHVKPVGRIMASGQRMTRMIDQLLDFTRARVGGGIEVRPRAANLGELCGQAIGELELANPDWKIERGVLGDLDGSWDPDRLLQILSNLIGNAGQHGDQDAGILVLLDGRGAEQVTLRVHNKGTIPPALLPGLFDPFRATRHRRDQSRGLGLGLFIVKELIRAHGGTVEVSSTEVAGTTFTIALPRHAPGARLDGAPT